jgi:hypothetical protein
MYFSKKNTTMHSPIAFKKTSQFKNPSFSLHQKKKKNPKKELVWRNQIKSFSFLFFF